MKRGTECHRVATGTYCIITINDKLPSNLLFIREKNFEVCASAPSAIRPSSHS
jgi:hypothetical protein